jgi:NAD(P)H-dependent FMN reductase
MSKTPKILAFAGSARRDSLNKKLAAAAADAAREAGAEITLIDLADYELPLYHGDVEAADGLPENARRLKRLFIDHDGLLVACPEYNSSITPLLKNTIDWVSRREGDDEPPLVAYRGKVVALVSASPGGLGGLRGLVHVRDIFGNLGCLVLPDQKAFSKAYAVFDENGRLKNDADRDALGRVTDALVRTVRGQLAEDGD